MHSCNSDIGLRLEPVYFSLLRPGTNILLDFLLARPMLPAEAVEQMSEGDLTQKSAANVVCKVKHANENRVQLRLPGLKPSHDPRTELEGDAQLQSCMVNQ